MPRGDSSTTIVVESRIDVARLASIAQYYRAGGVMINTLSGLLGQIAVDFSEVLYSNGKALQTMDYEEALTYINTYYRLQRRTKESMSKIAGHLAMPDDTKEKADDAMSMLQSESATSKNSTKEK